MKSTWWIWKWLLFAVLLMLIANAADYFYQADMHGWFNPLWENGVRAAKWGMWDWIPHDPWHIAQWLRNLCMLMGPLSLTYWVLTGVWDFHLPPTRMWQTPVYILALYALTRGATFSLFYKLWN